MNSKICYCGGSFARFTKTRFYSMVKCNSCGLVKTKKTLSDKEISALYNNKYYIFDPVREMKDELIAKAHLQSLQKKITKGRLLDVGCGKGYFLLEAKKAGFKVKGVEISKDAAKFAKDSGLDIFNGTLENFNSKEKFDAITMFDLIEHLSRPLKALKIAKSLLKKDGILYIETPNIESAYRKYSPIRNYWSGYNKFHIVLFSPKSLTIMLRKVGFSNIETKTDEIKIFSKDILWKPGFGILFKDILKLFKMNKTISNLKKFKDKPKVIKPKLGKTNKGDVLHAYAKN